MLKMDEVDTANKLIETLAEKDVAFIRYKAAQMPKGETGECEYCGEHSQRIVNGACARCRDKLKLD